MSEKLETDLQRISILAEKNWADNWNFRAYLQQEVSPTHLDKTAQKINGEISAAIDCTACGNCCREIHPHLEAFDVARLASGLKQSPSQLATRLKTAGDETLVFCEKPCPLLKENKCTVYQHRPNDCREYPHLHKDDFLGGSIGTIENYRVCPIVFNVYNKLKSCFSYDSAKDYIGASDPEQVHGSSFKEK